MKNTDFVTVVYQVSDWDAFKKTWSNICTSLGSDVPVNGASVCGVSKSDEMSRVEYLESLLDEHRIDYDA